MWSAYINVTDGQTDTHHSLAIPARANAWCVGECSRAVDFPVLSRGLSSGRGTVLNRAEMF